MNNIRINCALTTYSSIFKFNFKVGIEKWLRVSGEEGDVQLEDGHGPVRVRQA